MMDQGDKNGQKPLLKTCGKLVSNFVVIVDNFVENMLKQCGKLFGVKEKIKKR
ncbi:hypothetical protein [Adlercreutzia agrestimuris]|uniref:hypothetical protein n=1 Tax=Adlercreutzia agrestimuris TaxID=2941324 RepID=UPI00203ED09B|nr:hypothetical protein [Adlercreutzia agrestimuris]